MAISDAEFGELRSDTRHTKEGVADIKRILEKQNETFHGRINENKDAIAKNTASIGTIKMIGKLAHTIWGGIIGYIVWMFRK